MRTEIKSQNRSDVEHSCCCSPHSDLAHVPEAGLESFRANLAPDRTRGRSGLKLCTAI